MPSTHKQSIDNLDPQEITLENIQDKGLTINLLILSMREAIKNNSQIDLLRNLKQLSGEFQIQTNEISEMHNLRIYVLLQWLQANPLDNSWNQPIILTKDIKNHKKVVVETTDISVEPDVGLVVSEPISHNGKIGNHITRSCQLREIRFLKFYGIDSEIVSPILSPGK